MGIYISLTTVPERLAFWESFYQNLQSLLNQKTHRDYKVIVNIPLIYKFDNIPYMVPDLLDKLSKRNPKLIINRIETDRGPIEKLIGCFNIVTDPNDIIVALDDDQIYSEDMLEYILTKKQKYPECVIGFRGDTILDKRTFWQNGVRKYILLGSNAQFPLLNDTYAVVPGHWHSVTYERRFIENDIFDDYFLTVADSDDHIISFYLLEKQRRFVMLAYDREDNFIPVNNLAAGIGKPSHNYPIVKQLPYPGRTGFVKFRDKQNNHVGFIRDDFHKNWNFDPRFVYFDYPFKPTDEVIIPTPLPEPSLQEQLVVNPGEPKPISFSKKSEDVGEGDVKPDPLDDFVLPGTSPIITLTTIPSRLKTDNENGFIKCLRSLIAQDYPGKYEIHLNIPNVLKKTGEEYIIPQWLINLIDGEVGGNKIKIFRTDDHGPLTKLLPTVRRTTIEDNPIIVVCDDDLVYYPEMLIEQVRNQHKFKNSSVGYDGIDCWKPLFEDVRDHFITAHRKHIQVKILQHYKSISYKREFFKEDFEQFINDYYEWNDDILLAAYMGLHNRRRVFTYHEKYTPHLSTIDDWRQGNAAITFPLLGHTSHETQEGCTLYRMEEIPHFKGNPYSSDLIEKYINEN